jgi:hypothetical protein
MKTEVQDNAAVIVKAAEVVGPEATESVWGSIMRLGKESAPAEKAGTPIVGHPLNKQAKLVLARSLEKKLAVALRTLVEVSEVVREVRAEIDPHSKSISKIKSAGRTRAPVMISKDRVRLATKVLKLRSGGSSRAEVGEALGLTRGVLNSLWYGAGGKSGPASQSGAAKILKAAKKRAS